MMSSFSDDLILNNDNPISFTEWYEDIVIEYTWETDGKCLKSPFIMSDNTNFDFKKAYNDGLSPSQVVVLIK